MRIRPGQQTCGIKQIWIDVGIRPIDTMLPPFPDSVEGIRYYLGEKRAERHGPFSCIFQGFPSVKTEGFLLQRMIRRHAEMDANLEGEKNNNKTHSVSTYDAGNSVRKMRHCLGTKGHLLSIKSAVSSCSRLL